MFSPEDIIKVTNDVLRLRPQIEALTSYADAFTAAVKRHGDFQMDDFKFQRRADIQIPTDYVSTGRHTMVFQLEGTKKLYRVMIEPMLETHK